MEIVLHSKGEDYTVLIDEEDFHKVSKYTWHINHHHKCSLKYCEANIKIDGKKTAISIHRLIMGLDYGDKQMINHKDGNGLNNKKSNLEICDAMYNNQSINTKRNFGCISIRKNRLKKYCAQVTINKKRYYKCFYTKEEAQAYLDGLYEIAIAETVPFS